MYVVCVLLHASGTPNSTIGGTAQDRCLSFEQAEARGLDVTALREEFMTSVDAFPDRKTELAASWSDLQYALRDRAGEAGVSDLGGSSVFSVVLFEPDGRIALFVHRGLGPDQEPAFCEAVEQLAEEYRFPLESETRFSQCGTTHFKEN